MISGCNGMSKTSVAITMVMFCVPDSYAIYDAYRISSQIFLQDAQGKVNVQPACCGLCNGGKAFGENHRYPAAMGGPGLSGQHCLNGAGHELRKLRVIDMQWHLFQAMSGRLLKIPRQRCEQGGIGLRIVKRLSRRINR